MRRSSRLLPLLLLAAAVTQVPAANAAVETPRTSPGASVRQTIGTTDVTIDFHRPGVKNRTIWGGLVPWNEVWRLGANETTKITFEHPVKVAGQPVAAGSYGFFAIPKQDGWTFILGKEPEQWGAYSYKPEDDVLRVEAKPQAAPKTEWMTFTITPQDADTAEVAVQWDELRVGFPVDVDFPAVVWSELDAALGGAGAKDGDLYLQAARFARDRNERLDDGLRWVDLSIAAGETWWNLEAKANLLHLKGRTTEAIPLLEKALELSKGKAPEAYRAGVEKTLAEYRAASAG